MLPRSCSAYSRRLKSVLILPPRKGRGPACSHLALHRASGSWRAASGGRLPSRIRREPAPRLACTQQHELSPVQARRMCLIARARTPTKKKTPWPRSGPRCSARARPGRASRSIEDRLHREICHAVSRSGLFRNPRCRTSPPRT